MSGYPLPRWLILILPLGLIIVAALAGFTLTQKTVTLVDGDQTTTITTSAATVGEAVASAGIPTVPEDLFQPAPDAPLHSGMTITLTRALSVEVIDGAEVIAVRTHQKKIAAIVAEAGRTLSPADVVYADGQRLSLNDLTIPGPVPRSILIRRAVPFVVIEGGKATSLLTAARTVGEALAESGLTLFAADVVTPPLDAAITSGMTVTITRSHPISIDVDGLTLTARTSRATVAEALAEAGVAVAGLDYTIPPLADPLPADGSPIRVIRVVEGFTVEHSPLPYDTQFQAVPDLEIDHSKLIQIGAEGVMASHIRVRYENGIEVSRALEDQWLVAAPQPRLVGYGTQIVLRTVDTPNGPVEYWRAIQMNATSYSASRAGTPPTAPHYGRTRSGKTLTVGMVAVDPRVIPLGTRLYIPGYGIATAEDTGGGIKGLMIDLGYDDWNYVSWHSDVTVYVLAPVPPAIQIRWVLP
jgi:uncharacterized protein YabE (DUF348 family)